MLKAIETVYSGYKFRSRTEARWAVWFDALGVEYRYEEEGFNLDGVYYLPDFHLPGYPAFVEIKGTPPTQAEWEKAKRLAQFGQVWILEGSPWMEFDQNGQPVKSSYVAHVYWPDLDDWDKCILTQCRRCGCITPESRSVHMPGYHHDDLCGYGTCCSPRAGIVRSPELVQAYTVARQARFEFGEMP